MITNTMIERINFLAKKKKEVGLSEDEATEQQNLYTLYRNAFKESFLNQLLTIKFVDAEGNDVTDPKLKELKKRQK